MNLKKLLLLVIFLSLSFFKVKESSTFSIESRLVIVSSFSDFSPVIKRINTYRLEKIQERLLNECKFRHEKNFKELEREIFALMLDECDKYDLPYSIFFSVVDRESGFRFIPNSQGSGAMGYMQLMPRTYSVNARELKLEGGHTKENNIKAGSYLLYKLFTDWKSKHEDNETAWTWALAQYAVGLGGLQVKDSSGIRYRIPESTKPGIEKVMRNYNEDL